MCSCVEVVCSGDITNVGTWKVLEKQLHKPPNGMSRGHALSSPCVKAHRCKAQQKPLIRGARRSFLALLCCQGGVSAGITLIMVQTRMAKRLLPSQLSKRWKSMPKVFPYIGETYQITYMKLS